MRLPAPLIKGRLLRRYKRFFADIELADGTIVTAHTPNTGSMQQCAIAGYPVLISAANNPKRKLRYTLELIKVKDHWVDTHTQRTNRVVEEALNAGRIAGLSGYRLRPEFPFGASRIDFLLESDYGNVLVEVKNVTLCQPEGCACFPDAVTTRGQKHLLELMAAVEQGYRAVIFFLVQRAEAERFAPADHIDPAYGQLLRQAVNAGVEALAYRTEVTSAEVTVGRPIPVDLSLSKGER
ncbi:MAG: DNA/RNA nuclease SfsA [Desulfuromonas sp.]|nr:MAG: DNA/RNA nuclease SfsA [Desulfuromonas sp.]